MKPTTFDPEGASLVGDLFIEKVRDLKFDSEDKRLAQFLELAQSALKCPRRHPICGFVRDTAKDHGTKKLIDGHMTEGATVIIVMM